MTIEFNCQKCEGSFEIDAQDLIDGSEPLECPHCENKVSKAMLEDFTSALSELNAQLNVLSKKFTLTMEIDSEELGADVDDDEVESDDEDEDEEDLDEEDDDEDDDDEDDDEEEVEDDDDD